MPRKESLSDFVKNFLRYGNKVNDAYLKEFNIQTLDALGLAQSRTPLVTGDLEGSGDTLKAKFTAKGVVSSIVFRVPYAEKIENGEVEIQPEGTVYNVGGGKITKKRKGREGFTSSAVNDKANDFIRALERVITREFLKA